MVNSNSKARMRQVRLRAAGMVVFSLLLTAVFYPVLLEWVRFSRTVSYYSHLILIPFVSAILLYRGRRDYFRELDGAALPGGIIFVLGLVLTLLFAPSRSNEVDKLFFSVIGIVTIWIGGFIFILGRSCFHKTMFPVLFLFFSAPVPSRFFDGLISLMQQASVHVTFWLFSLTWLPFYHHGAFFELPGLKIEVARECSGIRSVLTLIILATLAGWLILSRRWSRISLVALVLPIAILENGFRIVALCLLTLYVDERFMFGSLHNWSGTAFFGIAMCVLFLPTIWFLRRLESRHNVSAAEPPVSSGVASAKP